MMIFPGYGAPEDATPDELADLAEVLAEVEQEGW